MKSLSIFITIGLIAIVKGQDPACQFETDSEGLLACKLTGGGIMPENRNKEIAGNPGADKTFADVQRVYSLEPASTDMIYSIFNNFVNLKKLELTNGIVEELKQEMLYNCTKLEKLAINKGIIKTIDSNTFINCPALAEIDLGKNTISGILSGAFNGLPNLKTLNFNNNELTNIQGSIFNVSTLQSLDLSNNGLALTNRSIFTYTNELLSLNLAENGITLLVKEQFNGLSKLTELDFTNNDLNATQDTALEYLEALQVAKFKSNNCIDKDYTDYSQSLFAGDFAVCIKNFNGASIMILSNLVLVVSVLIKLFN
ncbi:unnamed protein product [Chironomus riparius]|uniref:Uncharacterized protein n=1 Tax=Chironomus riparius TaxID=315576 RepID=A0A9N9SAX6_9DIPT|nr:unnamed protein product [Chironomus riparius]